MFQTYKSGTLVLVEGHPGSGKSTFTRKLVIDWAKGDVLTRVKFVFLIPLRLCNLSGMDDSLTSLLSHLYHSEKQDLPFEVVESIEKGDGEGVCFILDGSDEYDPQCRWKSVIYKLLNKVYLPQSMIIVSSRPEVNSSELKKKANVVLELTGFARENVLNYIDSFPFSSGVGAAKSCAQASTLKEYLKSHSNTFDMCRLPMCTAMICLLYQHKKEIVFSTETKIYEELVKFMILRHYKRTENTPPSISHSGLLDPEKKYLETLCKLAIYMTANSRHTVSVGESPDDPANASFFGLVSVDRAAELIGFEVVHMRSFLHTTLQEFLAAYYITQFHDQDKQLGIISNLPCSNNVWKFYFGLGKFEPEYFLEVFYRSLRKIDEKDKFLAAIQFAYESQQTDVCSILIKVSHGIAFDSKLKPSDCTAISYVVSNSSEPFLIFCSVQHCTDKGLTRKIWGKIDSNKLLSLLSLTLMYVGYEDILAMAEQLHHCKALKNINISQNQLTSNNVLEIAKKMKECKKVQELIFSHNNICGGIVSLVDHLNELAILDLSHNKIQPTGVICAVDRFKTLVYELRLQGNSSVAQDDILAVVDSRNPFDNMLNLHLDICDKGFIPYPPEHLIDTRFKLFPRFDSTVSCKFVPATEEVRKRRKLSDSSKIESHPKVTSFNWLFWYKVVNGSYKRAFPNNSSCSEGGSDIVSSIKKYNETLFGKQGFILPKKTFPRWGTPLTPLCTIYYYMEKKER